MIFRTIFVLTTLSLSGCAAFKSTGNVYGLYSSSLFNPLFDQSLSNEKSGVLFKSPAEYYQDDTPVFRSNRHILVVHETGIYYSEWKHQRNQFEHKITVSYSDVAKVEASVEKLKIGSYKRLHISTRSGSNYNFIIDGDQLAENARELIVKHSPCCNN